MKDKSQDFGTSPGRAQSNDWDGGRMTLKRKEFSFGVRSKTQEWQNDPETSLNDSGTIDRLKVQNWPRQCQGSESTNDLRTVCDGTQNVKRYRYRYFFPVPNIFDTDTGTFFGTKFFRYRFRDFFPIPNFTDTGSETFFWYHFFPIPREKLTIPVTHHKYLSPKFWQWKSRFLLSSRRWPRLLFLAPTPPVQRVQPCLACFCRWPEIFHKISKGVGVCFCWWPKILSKISKGVGACFYWRPETPSKSNFSDTGS